MGPRNWRRCAFYPKPTSWKCFLYTVHLRSCTALSTAHPFDASESKRYMAALSTELSAKWHKQKEKRGLNLERWHWKQMDRFETMPTPSQGWQSVSITSLAIDDADLPWRCHLVPFYILVLHIWWKDMFNAFLRPRTALVAKVITSETDFS